MRICTEIFLKFMSKTKLSHQNFLLTFQKSLTSNIFLDPKEGVNPPLSPPPMRMYGGGWQDPG